MKIILILILINLNFLNAQTNIKTSAEDIIPVTQQKQEIPAFIKVSDVPENATKVIIELKEVTERIQENKEIEDMHKTIKPYCDSLSLIFKNSNYKNIHRQNARELQKMQSEMAIYAKQLEEWESLLKSRIELYDVNHQLLKEHSAFWTQTHINAVKEVAPYAILKHITSVIVQI